MALSNDPPFDPYRKWLGIPKHQRPPTHYQLLGLSQGESDTDVIEEAAIRQSTHLRAYQNGPHGELCTKLLNEIGRAQQVLLHPEKKGEYDRLLQQRAKPAAPADANRQISAKPMVPPSAENPFEILTPETPKAASRAGKPPRKVPRDDARRHPVRSIEKASRSRSNVLVVGALVGGLASFLLLAGVGMWMLTGRSAKMEPQKRLAPEVAEKKPDAARPPDVVEPPAIKPIAKPPVEPMAPKPADAGQQDRPPLPADVARLFGDWQTIIVGPPEMTRQIFVAHNAKGGWRIFYTFLLRDLVVGAAHGENASFANGQISFTLVYDKKPVAGWADQVATRLRLENGELIETQIVDNNAAIRPNVRSEASPGHRALLGKWTARFEDGDVVDMFLERRSPDFYSGEFVVRDPDGSRHVTLMDALRPYGDGFAFEIDFRTSPADPTWSKYQHVVLRPLGSNLQAEFRGPPAKVGRFVLTRISKEPPLVAQKGAPPQAGPSKTSPPSADKIAETQKVIRSQFAKEYLAAKKSAPERATLADKLLKLAQETNDDLAARYVLLSEARDLACQAGQWALAVEALDALDDEFSVDALAQREMALQLLVKSGPSKEAAEEAARTALTSLLECVAADRIDGAQRFAALGANAAAKSQVPSLISQWSKHEQEMKALVRDYERFEKARPGLDDMPDNAAANLDVGRYLTLRKRDWDGGLPYLARAGAGALPEAARNDLENPRDAKAQHDAGNLWWNLAEKNSGWARAALLGRAGHWYRQAAAMSTGLTLAVLTDRITSIDEAVSLFRPAQSTVDLAEVRRYKGHAGEITSLFVAPDGKKFYSGSLDRTIRTWDLATGKQLDSLNARAPVLSFSFSPSQRFLAVIGDDKLRYWNLATMEVFGKDEVAIPDAIWVGPDQLFWTFAPSGFFLFDLSTGQGTRNDNFYVPGARVCGDHGRGRILTLGKEVRVFDAILGTGLTKGKRIAIPAALCGTFSADGRWLLVGCADNQLRLYDHPQGKFVTRFDLPNVSPRALAFSPDGRRFLCATDDMVVRLWDVDSPKEIAHSAIHDGPIQAIAFTRDGRSALSAGDDALVRLWNLPRERK